MRSIREPLNAICLVSDLSDRAVCLPFATAPAAPAPVPAAPAPAVACG